MRTHPQVAKPVVCNYNADRPSLQLFGHQKEAVERYKHSDCIALFFEMGCGKSLCTLRIAQEKYKAGLIDGLLVIAPNDVHRQWYNELVYGVDVEHDGVMWQELEINFEAQCVGGKNGQSCLYAFEFDKTFKFVSVNVDTFSTPHKWESIVAWANSGRYMIAIDEATVIKNPSSKRSQRLLYEFNNVVKRGRAIIHSEKKFPVRAVLTGTPVTNGPIDLWAIMEFLRPNYFGRNYWAFRAYFGMYTKLAVNTGGNSTRDVDVLLNEKTWHGIHNSNSFEEASMYYGCTEDTYLTVKQQTHFSGPYKHADELKQLIDPVATFVKLVDCVDMPPVTYIERTVHLSDAQQEAYNAMKRDLFTQYGEHTMSAANKLVVNMRLQQISSGFIVGQKEVDVDDLDEVDLSPSEVVWLGESNPKLDALMRDVAEVDKPLLILTRYSAEAAKIYELCIKAGYRTGLFTGWKVLGGVDAFKAGDLDILVANSNKISRGFNLQIAHTTLFYSNTFSMEVRQQAEFRTFRMGQKHTCLYVDYTSSDVDRTINKALRMKKSLLEFIRDKNIKELV